MVIEMRARLSGTSASKRKVFRTFGSARLASTAAVSVLTAHSSKGLEFRCVIFLGLGDLDEQSQTGDPTKILHVGMTRAREKLVLTSFRQHPWVMHIATLAA